MRPASLAVVAGAVAWLAAAASAGPRGKDDGHLDYHPTYAGALLEARVRNLPVFVSRHKDG